MQVSVSVLSQGPLCYASIGLYSITSPLCKYQCLYCRKAPYAMQVSVSIVSQAPYASISVYTVIRPPMPKSESESEQLISRTSL